MSVPRSGRKKPQRVLPNPAKRHWTGQVKAEIRLCPSLTPLTDLFTNSRTVTSAEPRQQRDQSPGEREPERPHCERTPGGIGASAREAHRSAHSQRSRALNNADILKACLNFWVIQYWQTTPNKTRTVSHRALVKTQQASDSFVWAGFIASWFVTSPALTSHYTWIDFTRASRHITQSVPHSVKIDWRRFLYDSLSLCEHITTDMITLTVIMSSIFSLDSTDLQSEISSISCSIPFIQIKIQ